MLLVLAWKSNSKLICFARVRAYFRDFNNRFLTANLQSETIDIINFVKHFLNSRTGILGQAFRVDHFTPCWLENPCAKLHTSASILW